MSSPNASTAPPKAELDRLCIDYRDDAAPGGLVRAVEGAQAAFPAGAIVSIVGPSGCGKTSLVRAMAGLLAPSGGRVLVDGEGLGGTRPRTAVIFQDYGLLPWKTAWDNVELPLLIRGARAAERRDAVAPLFEEFGLGGFERSFPARLSGGMRQRVAIARAFVAQPDLLLMDEPFSSLDALTRESMQDALLASRSRHGAAVALVTHSIEEAVYLSDAVYVMRGRNPGRIAARIDTGPAAGAPAPRGPAYRADPRFHELASEVRRALSDAPGAGGGR
jgi:NitT/TauT family transport system ATP-binding protein